MPYQNFELNETALKNYADKTEAWLKTISEHADQKEENDNRIDGLDNWNKGDFSFDTLSEYISKN